MDTLVGVLDLVDGVGKILLFADANTYDGYNKAR